MSTHLIKHLLTLLLSYNCLSHILCAGYNESVMLIWSNTEFQMSIVANDNSNPARTGFVEAFITVIRDQFPPFFINTPYSVTINEYTNIDTSIFNVNATDNDLVVCHITGLYCLSIPIQSSIIVLGCLYMS